MAERRPTPDIPAAPGATGAAGADPSAGARPRPRVPELDALRGFAICGIMLVNTWQHVRAAAAGQVAETPVDQVIEVLLESRFYPIFALLFGVSLVLFLDSAAARTGRPRLALFMRLVVLAGFGLLHQLVNPGEVLLPYAAFGIVLLLPLSCLPRPVALAAGLAGAAGGVVLRDPWLLIAGLFPLGMALVRYRPPARLLAPAFAVSAVLGAAATWLWLTVRAAPAPWLDPYAARLLAAIPSAAAYATGAMLLARASRRVSAVLEPLGRMALTNYLSSTLLILAAVPFLTADPTRWSVVGFAAAVLALQAVWSRRWLRAHRYGPLEWVWRCATWWRITPNARSGEPAGQ